MQTGKKRIRITDPLERRVAMVNGRFDLPDTALEWMKKFREAADEFARVVGQANRALGKEGADYGRLIAAVDQIQIAKNIACDAVILPHATKEDE